MMKRFVYSKYVFFIIVSFFCAMVAGVFSLLVDNTFTFNQLIKETIMLWGFCYPVGFIAYEKRKASKISSDEGLLNSTNK